MTVAINLTTPYVEDPRQVDYQWLASATFGLDGSIRVVLWNLQDNGDGTFTKIGQSEVTAASTPQAIQDGFAEALQAGQASGMVKEGTIMEPTPPITVEST